MARPCSTRRSGFLIAVPGVANLIEANPYGGGHGEHSHQAVFRPAHRPVQLKSSSDQLMDQRPLFVAAESEMGRHLTSMWAGAGADERQGSR
jgi:hypothetical protein